MFEIRTRFHRHLDNKQNQCATFVSNEKKNTDFQRKYRTALLALISSQFFFYLMVCLSRLSPSVYALPASFLYSFHRP